MKEKNNWLWVSEIVAALYVLLFVYTGVDKLRNWETFQGALEKSTITAAYSQFLGIAVPTAELLIAALLVIPASRHIGQVLGTALMSAFTIYVAYMIAFSPELPCTCGGIIQSMTWRQHLVLNSTYVILGIFSLIVYIQHQLFIAINRSNAEHLQHSRQEH